MSAFDVDGPNSVYQQMMRSEGDTIVLSAARDPEAVVRGGAREREASISAEAFEQLLESARVWVGTRMLRHYERTGRGAHNVTVELKVSTTGPLEPGGEPPRVVRFEVLDGRVRLRAVE